MNCYVMKRKQNTHTKQSTNEKKNLNGHFTSLVAYNHVFDFFASSHKSFV